MQARDDPAVWEPGPAPRQAQVIGSITITTTQETPVPEPHKEIPPWKQPAFIITLLLLPLVYIVAIMVLIPSMGFTSDAKMMVITAVIGSGILAAILGFWLSSSYGSSQKTEAMISGRLTPTPPPGTTTASTNVTNDPQGEQQ